MGTVLGTVLGIPKSTGFVAALVLNRLRKLPRGEVGFAGSRGR